MNASTDKEAEFLRELTALSLKYGIAIHGCGCCGSPYLTDLPPESAGGAYVINDGQIEYRDPQGRNPSQVALLTLRSVKPAP
jgi:hypothetical protein